MVFVRRREDFICEHCHWPTQGTGYTNHCPKCLWSRHVDIEPGDRQAECGGMMEPIGSEPGRRYFKITHRCQKCGYVTTNRSAASDNTEILISLTTKQVPTLDN